MDPQARSSGAQEGPAVPVAHHFATPQQQFEAGKTGMWLFLATEVLLFGGLFCAYAVYRSNHPDVFYYGHKFLDVSLGATNTVILICSSLTMAWAVRCAQLGRRRGLILLLSLTLLCACGFLGIKYVEYEQKWKHGLLWGKHYQPQTHSTRSRHGPEAPLSRATQTATQQAPASSRPATGPGRIAGAALQTRTHAPATEKVTSSGNPPAARTRLVIERSNVPLAAEPPQSLAELAPELAARHKEQEEPRNVQTFFAVYFLMTGLHGLHVIAGMIAIGWILVRAVRGHFGRHYFTPVDLVGLYWHLVDLIWIYLFPLLYLIR